MKDRQNYLLKPQPVISRSKQCISPKHSDVGRAGARTRYQTDYESLDKPRTTTETVTLR